MLDSNGRTLGYGRAGSGNPTASGIEGAAAAVLTAARRALRSDATPTDPKSSALIALAGSESAQFRHAVAALIGPLGFEGGVATEPDLAGMFFSGTFRQHGYGLIAGTGAVAARIEHGKLERVAGGAGWLLGDSGSGFWIGRRVLRAVTAAIDGLGPSTALTALVLGSLGLTADPGSEQTNTNHANTTLASSTDAHSTLASSTLANSAEASVQSRPRALFELIDAVYALPPVQLARFAPLAFQAQTDAVARDILTGAATALSDLLATVHDPRRGGELVVGGSVLTAGLRNAPEIFGPPLAAVAPDVTVLSVPDGLVGAAVLSLRHAGVAVDAALFSRLRAGIARSAAAYTEEVETS